MNEGADVPTLFYVVAAVALLVFAYNLRPLTSVRIGRSERGRSLRTLAQLRDALVIGVGQQRVYRRRFAYATVMHTLLAWGFIELVFATTVDFLVLRGWFVDVLPGKDEPWFAAVNDLGGLMLLAGVIMALVRRHWHKPPDLPHTAFVGRGHVLGDTGILVFLLLLAIGGFLSEAARLSIEQPATAPFSFVGYTLASVATPDGWSMARPALWWSHAILSLAFIGVLPLTKMFHVMAVVANVALTDRRRRGSLRAMHVSEMLADLEADPETDPETLVFGAAKPDDFTWKQLLDAIACTECARCTMVCPAHSAARPLSPMKLVTDIRRDLYQKTLGRGEPAALIGERIEDDELWSCTTCGACSEVCPVLIEHVPTFVEMRRHRVMSEGKPPMQAVERLESMRKKGNPYGFPARDRTKWATEHGINLPLMSDRKRAEVLYWVGCAGAYDARNQNVARAMIHILQAAKVDFAVLGNEEACTGDAARRMGDEYLFESLALRNIERLNRYDFDRIVTPCAHCLHTIGNEYPDFGGHFRIEHHSSFINNLMVDGRLNVSRNTDTVTFHDPCYLGRHNHIYDAPRDVLRATLDTNSPLVEMDQAREQSFCCGAGGGNMWYDLDQGKRINVERMHQATATGANTLAVGCSFCLVMMEDASRLIHEAREVEVRDIAEIVVDRLNDKP